MAILEHENDSDWLKKSGMVLIRTFACSRINQSDLANISQSELFMKLSLPDSFFQKLVSRTIKTLHYYVINNYVITITS